MLQFNPYHRPTAKELISNPIFDNIRYDINEADASHNIHVDIDVDQYKK